MRYIKFRAWDKQYKKIVNVTMLNFGSDELDHDDNFGEPKSIEHFELMQYTGLKDKNGKEIYEGDIAKITWAEGTYRDSAYGGALNYTELGVMQFENGQFSFFVKDSLLDEEYKNLTVEIVGNIYENPELLTHPAEGRN